MVDILLTMVLTTAGPVAVPTGRLVEQRWWESVTLVVTELVLLWVLLDLYDLVVPHALGDAAGAVGHGHALWDLEAAWGVDVERSWYDALAGHSALLDAAHLYYAESIYLVPAVVAILLVVHDVERYRAMRSTFVATTLLAYAVFWAYPVAPPCLLPGSGLACGEPAPPDPFGALPSLHVAWAAVSAVGLVLLSTRPWVRGLAVAHVALTVAVVLATGHHFVVDTVTGLAVVLAVVLVRRLLPTTRPSVRRADPAASAPRRGRASTPRALPPTPPRTARR
ncbi:phosphatase PAP2 family protein [Actinomycetospora sp. TBRC 11914]|uniref:phosphatase PAP2 family protein n=1 Tax=Actinomycetospora sp. TBRC 11914 TaxID=2729387 RepID=UPI00145D0FE7|nr:phosphatase PAP2 family protein [Actinomycetospora sp. TBRC 11914]NMO88464.1 phosphatase PAP2 family protein [Actinomycetospora sp. TBRC 11914]